MRLFAAFLTLGAIIPALALNGGMSTKENVPGRKASELFASAPAQIMPLLPVNARLDMVDYFAFGSDKPTNNALGGKARITAMTDSEVRYVTASGATGQLVVVPLSGGDSILVLVQTYSVPQPDSSVEFFTTGWTPAKVAFDEPLLADWLTPAGRADILEAELFVPFVLWEADVEPDGSKITLTNSMGSYYTPTDSAKASSLLHKQLIYTRKGKKYVKDNPEK